MRYTNSETRENSEQFPNKLVEKEELIILEDIDIYERDNLDKANKFNYYVIVNFDENLQSLKSVSKLLKISENLLTETTKNLYTNCDWVAKFIINKSLISSKSELKKLGTSK
ncbi:hypothetical protein BpHYR1_009305 [Brachionus plicatilis]|uniref:Uncharacterized protein n=1 Tax=Brachionus plicatilis TaxID=10195 RepID=A0A3M7R7Y0_BRAPC|nr:hypothetical protein BpHYR1_009305 [Brachionus plicatilis]